MTESEKKIEQLQEELRILKKSKETFQTAYNNADQKAKKLTANYKLLSFHNLIHMKEIARLQEYILGLETKAFLDKLDSDNLLKW